MSNTLRHVHRRIARWLIVPIGLGLALPTPAHALRKSQEDRTVSALSATLTTGLEEGPERLAQLRQQSQGIRWTAAGNTLRGTSPDGLVIISAQGSSLEILVGTPVVLRIVEQPGVLTVVPMEPRPPQPGALVSPLLTGRMKDPQAPALVALDYDAAVPGGPRLACTANAALNIPQETTFSIPTAPPGTPAVLLRKTPRAIATPINQIERDALLASTHPVDGASSSPSRRPLVIERLSDPKGVAYDPATHTLFITEQGANRLRGFSALTGRPTGFLIGHLVDPKSVAYDPVTHTLFIVEAGANRVRAFDATTGHPTGVVILGVHAPYQDSSGLAYDPVTHQVFALYNDNAGQGDSYTVGFSAWTGRPTGFRVTHRKGPDGLAVDAARRQLFFSESYTNRLVVMDLDAGTWQREISGLHSPRHFAYDPETQTLFIVEYGEYASQWIQGYSVVTGQPVGRKIIKSGYDNPIGLAYDASSHAVFVLEGRTGELLAFSTTTGKPTAIRPHATGLEEAVADLQRHVAQMGSVIDGQRWGEVGTVSGDLVQITADLYQAAAVEAAERPLRRLDAVLRRLQQLPDDRWPQDGSSRQGLRRWQAHAMALLATTRHLTRPTAEGFLKDPGVLEGHLWFTLDLMWGDLPSNLVFQQDEPPLATWFDALQVLMWTTPRDRFDPTRVNVETLLDRVTTWTLPFLLTQYSGPPAPGGDRAVPNIKLYFRPLVTQTGDVPLALKTSLLLRQPAAAWNLSAVFYDLVAQLAGRTALDHAHTFFAQQAALRYRLAREIDASALWQPSLTAGLEEGVRVATIAEVLPYADPATTDALMGLQVSGQREVVRVPRGGFSQVSAPLLVDASLTDWVRTLVPHVRPESLDGTDYLARTKRLQEWAKEWTTRVAHRMTFLLDATHAQPSLPSPCPLILLVNPATVDRVDRAAVLVLLAQADWLVDRTIDLSRGSLGTITLDGRVYDLYA